MMIKDTFPILGEAYELKEYYRRLNKTATYEEAVEKYDDVVRLFNNSGIPQYDEFASILVKWKTEILNSFRRPYENRKLSNAYSENINGKLRTYITVSRGLGNFKRFRCRTLFALNPKIRGLDEREVHTIKSSNIKGHFPHEFHAKNVLFIHSHQPDSLEMDFSNQPDNLYYLF